MTITYEWKVSQLDREASTGRVTTVHWRIDAIDGAYKVNTFSHWSSRDGTSEIADSDLTEDVVLNWIWSNAVDKIIAEETLKKQIEEQKNPVKSTDLQMVNV
jgi:hypothetical protein